VVFDGNKKLKRVLRPFTTGDHFGDIAIIRNINRTASVVAHTQCELLRIDKDDYFTVKSKVEDAERLNKLAFLRPTPFMAGDGMTPEELGTLTSLGIVREFAKNEVILEEGNEVKSVYFIRKGSVRLVKWVELWRQRIDGLPANVPLGQDTPTVPTLPRRRNAIATPKYITWHHDSKTQEFVDFERGDRVIGRLLVLNTLFPGDFFEEKCVMITAPPKLESQDELNVSFGTRKATVETSEIADRVIHNDHISSLKAMKRIVDATTTFYSFATYVASDDSELIEFPNVEFLKVASDHTLQAMQTIVNLRPSYEEQVQNYLKARAFGIVKRKVVKEVLRKKKESP
jgi:CRP-like cAMP-binding protein